MAGIRKGHVVISVDTEPPVCLSGTGRSTQAGPTQLTAHTQLRKRAAELQQLLRRHQLRATWAVRDPAASHVPRILTESHAVGSAPELALVGDPTWVGETAGRTRFASQLLRRIEAAHQVGCDVGALKLDGVTLESGLDLLVRHRISVVWQGLPAATSGSRETRRKSSSTGAFRPQSLRFGIWQAPSSLRFPLRGAWWRGGAARVSNRLIRQAVQQAQVAHVVLNLPSLSARDLDIVGAVLQRIRRQVEDGVLAVKTLGELGDALNQQPQRKSGQSVLRRVA